jgi:hypothetical protein
MVFLALGVLGGILALVGVSVSLGLRPDEIGSGLTRDQLLSDALLSLIAKGALIASGVAILQRSTLAQRVLMISLAVSLADSTYKLAVIIPHQAAEQAESAGSIGVYFGFLLMVGVSGVLYVSAILYLRSERAQAEFGVSSISLPSA